MVRTALFCSGKGSHLTTINIARSISLDIEPIFFFSNNTEAPCYDKAMDMWPNIEARAMHPIVCNSRKEYDQEIREMMDPYRVVLILEGVYSVADGVVEAPKVYTLKPMFQSQAVGADTSGKGEASTDPWTE